jgi:beta-N-acetylhexosaminidase
MVPAPRPKRGARQESPPTIYNARMSMKDVRRHVGQLAIAGFGGYSIPQDLRLLAREFDLGGVVYFARNVEAPEQVAEMSRAAQSLASELPLWVSTDQEGGRVARLKSPFTVWPPMLTLGRSGDERLAERFASALAAELRAVGISLDFTPVLDILTNKSNPVIGDRALAERAEDVARLGTAIIRTLQSEGIAACGKHFPGHGDTNVDSHYELPIVEHPPDRIERVELVPFRAAIAANVACIMTAHVLVPSLDEEHPATLSPRIISMLKESLNFEGLVVTDDLAMKAISTKYGTSEATVAAIAAGCDAVLLCWPDYEAHIAALEAVIHAVEQGTLPLKRVEDAMTRQRRVKERFLAPPRPLPLQGTALRTLLGRDEHQAIAAEMARFA